MPELKKTLAIVGASFGPGLLPRAPGTFGTLPASFIHYAAVVWAPQEWFHPLMFLALIVFCLLSLCLAPVAVEYWGTSDPKHFTLDEMGGYFVIPLLAPSINLKTDLLLAFFVFRVFDIWKPFPISYIDQKVKGAVGILLDDIGAGIYAVVVIFVISRLFY